MTNRYPLVVNATTNQITEVQSGDNLLLDNTDLTTSTGDLVLDPAGDVDIKADLKNTADPNLKIDDDLYVTGTVGIGVAPATGIDIKIERTWNDGAATFFGTNIDITPTSYSSGSRLLRLANTSVTKFDVDVDGNTNIYGTTTLHGVTNVNTGIVPDTDEGAYIGTTAKPFSEAHIDEIRIGVSGDTEIDTATGGLTLDSATGETTVDDNLTVSGTLDIGNTAAYYTGISNQTLTLGDSTRRITLDGTNGNLDATGNLVVDGNSTLGDATSDDCAINARITTSLVPKTDSNDDLGTTLLRWANLYVDDITVTTGVSVGTLKSQNGTTALTLANTTGDVTVAGDLQVNGNDIKSSTGVSAITLDSNNVTVNGNFTVQGTQTILNTSTLSVEDATIELRRGASLSAADGGIQVNLTTDGTGAVTAFQQLFWDNSETSWRTTDGSTPKTIVNNVDATSLAKLTLNGGVVENFDDASAVSAGGIVSLDQNSSNIHVHTNPGGDFSFRVTNVPTTDLYTVTVLCIVKQGSTPGLPTSLYINGTDETSNVLGGFATFSKGTNGETDVYSFQLIRQSSAWHVLATQTNFA